MGALGVYPLHASVPDGRWCATFETAESLESPEESLAAMLAAIAGLPADAQALWSACDVREFNIGYDCGDRPRGFNNGLSNGTLRGVAELGAALRITLYPPDRAALGKRS